MKSDFYDSLNAFTNKTRMEIIRVLAEHGSSLSFKKLLEELGYENKNSSNLANHIKKLVEWGMVDKNSSSYSLTKLGKQLYIQINGIEKIIDEHNRDIMVRTSDFCFEPFDETKIAVNLIREANFTEEEAFELARTAKHKILNANIRYLTAPLIREYMNFILLESGKEEARHKLTRLGLPPYDVKQLLLNGKFKNSAMLYNELGKNIMEQFLLLNLLPQRFADFYLSGKIFFLHPESWGLNPLEVVIPGERFSTILIQLCKDYETSSLNAENSSNQFLPLVIKNVIDNFRNFFSGGVVITEFERVIRDLSSHFNQSSEKMLDLLFEMIPPVTIQHSHDKRNIHSRTWEIWFEIDLNNMDSFSDEINLIILKYYEDTKNAAEEKLHAGLISKPNIIVNLSLEHRSALIDAKLFRDLSDFHKKIIEIAQIHNVSFITSPLGKQPKSLKHIITPHLNPVTINKKQTTTLVLDKIYVNLPKIIQISENLLNSKHTDNFCTPIGEDQSQQTTTNQPSHPKDQEKFLETLNEWICYAINLFDEKMEILSKNISKLTNWPRVSQLLFDTDLFEKPTDLIDYKGSTPIYCSICLNGLKEAVQYFTQFPPDKTRDSFQFLTKILSTASSVLKKNTKKNGVTYVLSQNHLDNYLQMRYNQDSALLNHLSELSNSAEENPNNTKDTIIPSYHYSVFSDHNIAGIKKLVHNFKIYQQNMDFAYLNIFFRNKITKKQFLDAFKSVLKNQIHSFGFSRVFKSKGTAFFRYAGPYKPLSYYDPVIQSLIQEEEIK
jgi:DNA-binding HxlR family transcriptional regulator